MHRFTLFTLAAGWLPLAAFAGEKPLWEIRGRLDGEGGAPFQTWMNEIFIGEDPIAKAAGQAVFRIVGFENDATPGADWIAEIAGLEDAEALLEKVGEKGKRDDDGRILISEEGLSFLVWRDGDSTLRLAGPPENVGTTVDSAKSLPAEALISGWMDLERLGEVAEIESLALSLPDSLSFSAIPSGERITLRFDAELASEALAEEARALLDQWGKELSAEGEGTAAVPPLRLTSQGRELSMVIDVTEKDLTTWLEEMKIELESR